MQSLFCYAILRLLAFLTNSPESECSPGRADQLHDGVCSIEQRQHGRHYEQEKSCGLDREVLMRFAREVIPAESMERRFAIPHISATDIVERRYLVIKVRLRGPTTHARSVHARSISMINLEYRFHANSSEFRPLVSGLWSLCDLRLAFILRCAALKVSVSTAFRKFRNPALCFPAGSGAGPILIAGCGGKLSASFLKNAWRSGYSI